MLTSDKQSARSLVRPPKMPPPPASGDLNSPPRASGLEVIEHVNDAGFRVPLCVSVLSLKLVLSRPSPCEDMADYPYEIMRRGDLDL